MTTLNVILIFAVLVAANVKCYTITNEDPVLPTQKLLNANSFLRILPNHENKIITCPTGTYLDKTSLTCQFDNVEKIAPVADYNAAAQDSDAHPNPENCRSYLLIGAAGSFVQDCPSNLLFNEKTAQCDWPLEAGCCEYREKNSSRVVQNM